MPLVIKTELDMFVFADVTSYMVNPVNLVAAPGVGLALEFRKRAPKFFQPYRDACLSGELRIGTVQVIEDTDQEWGIINFPTKRHFADTSDKGDIVRGLEALRDLLKTDKYRYTSIGMPMLGCGLGKQDYEVVYPLMIDYLSNLDATVMLSMSPARTEMRPKYLVIVGPPSYGLTEEDKAVIDSTIDKVMNLWGASLSDYAGIVSGGYIGVDSYIAGEHFLKDVESTYVFKKTGGTPLVVKPDKARNGIGSNLIQNHLLCEIADDIIFFKPVGHNNNRLSEMQVWIKEDREKRHNDGHDPRRVAVFGEHQPDLTPATRILVHDQSSDDDA